MHPLRKKKSCKLNKNKSCNLSEWEKSCYLYTQNTMQPLHTQNHATSQQKKSRNLSTKTLRELQNAALRTSHWLSNVSNCSFQKFFFYSSDSSDSSDSSEKSCNLSTKRHFFITFGNCNLTHLTTEVMFSGQRFAILKVLLLPSAASQTSSTTFQILSAISPQY